MISFQTLAALLWDSWQVVVSASVAKRHDHHDWPVLDLVSSRLLPLPDDNRSIAVWGQEISLSHLWDTQNAKRILTTGEELRPCPLCLGSDCRSHFPLHCDGTVGVRESYASEITSVRDEFPHLVFLPLLSLHPQWTLLQTIHQARELPAPFDILDFVEPAPVCPVFYTDGSCMHPAHPAARLAAFSIVLDTAVSDVDRVNLAAIHRDSSTFPVTLVAVQVALATGLQTVNRAEFSAVIQIVRSVHAAIVYTDSAWTISTFQAIRDNPDPADHCSRGNFDLVRQLCELSNEKDLAQFELRKIKSHQKDCEVSCDAVLYTVLGNRFADKLAGMGTEESRSPFHKVAHTVANWFLRQRAALLAYRPCAIACDILRLDGFAGKQPEDSNKGKHLTNQELGEWCPAASCRPIPLEISDECLKAYMPGASTLLCFLRWFALLNGHFQRMTVEGAFRILNLCSTLLE